LKTLVLVLLFPWGAINSGLGVMNLAINSGDYANIIRLTGMSPVFFYVLDLLLLAVGFFFFISLLPLFGMAPEQRRSLFVLPVSLLLWGLVGVGMAYLTVPGSPIDVRSPGITAQFGDLPVRALRSVARLGYTDLPAFINDCRIANGTVHLSWGLRLPGFWRQSAS
jgi:hypothetical protein